MLHQPKFYAIAAVTLAVAVPAFAQFTPISIPDSSYTSSTTLIAITQPNATTVSSLTQASQTVSFSTALPAATVGVSGWSTWGTPPNTESATPRVLSRYSDLPSFTITLSTPTTTFGFEIEPNTFVLASITATFMNGGTTLGSITRSVNGNAGARLFAATSATPITSVVVTVPLAGNGFAIGQLRYAAAAITAIPAVSTTGILGLGMALLAGGALLARKQQTAF